MTITTPLSTRGRFIVDANGYRVRLAGVNWFGAHEDHGVPPGLDRVHRTALADTIADLGFNSVRFPFSVWMMDRTSAVQDKYLAANPDLRGSTPMQVYDACVAALTGAGLIVIPNCHMLFGGWCCDAANGIWWSNIHAWLAATDADWCWWGLNPTHAQGTTPVTNQLQYNWGDRAVNGLLTQDWRGVANPTVLDLLKARIAPRAGPGVS